MAEYVGPFGVVHNHLPWHVPIDPDGQDAVIDGDTIKVGGVLWRLDGFDAPPIAGSSSGKPHCDVEALCGIAARNRLRELFCGAAKAGTLRIDILKAHEKYGRQFVLVTVDGVNIGELMAADGLAHPFDGHGPKRPFCKCPDRLQEYERELEKFKLGRAASHSAAAQHRRWVKAVTDLRG